MTKKLSFGENVTKESAILNSIVVRRVIINPMSNSPIVTQGPNLHPTSLVS